MYQPITYTAYAGKWRIFFMMLTGLAPLSAVVLQIYITLSNLPPDRTFGGILVQIFSYFTIITNCIVALSMGSLLLAPRSRAGRFFGSPGVLTAVAVYITVVGLVYSLMLRGLWNPTGAGKVADEMLHTVDPILFVMFWLLFVNKQPLQWRSAFRWLWVPFIYMIYIVLRGIVTGIYPYPFIDVVKIGYLKTVLNALILLVVFWGFNCLFIYVGKLLAERQPAA